VVVEYDKILGGGLDRSRLDPLTRMWQFRDLLPVSPEETIVTLGEGCTPLVWEEKDNARPKNPKLGFKLDFQNPTCSFKDRSASLLLTKARKARANSTVIDSSGNAAASVAAYSARARINCEVFVPVSASPDKLLQISSYGSNISKIEGSRQDVLKAAKEYAKKSADRYYCSFQLNPFALEATATISYEIASQMNWREPDYVVVPMGTGGLLIGIARGFSRLREMDWIKNVPKIVGVQPSGCATIVRSLLSGRPIVPVEHPDTIAEGLKIGQPYRGEMAIEEIKSSRGTGVLVSDEEIREATIYLSNIHGIYAEPSAAASTAGFRKLSRSGYFPTNSTIVCIVTGSGLKTGKSLSTK
jgi:threonine synthase